MCSLCRFVFVANISIKWWCEAGNHQNAPGASTDSVLAIVYQDSGQHTESVYVCKYAAIFVKLCISGPLFS